MKKLFFTAIVSIFMMANTASAGLVFPEDAHLIVKTMLKDWTKTNSFKRQKNFNR